MGRFLTGLFGASGKQKSPPASALRVQTSMQGQPIPLLLGGLTRMASNLIWYGGFTVTQPSSGGGGGGKGGVTGAGGKGQGGGNEPTYSTWAQFAICEGLTQTVTPYQVLYINGSSTFFFTAEDNGWDLLEYVGDHSQTPNGSAAFFQPNILANRGISYVTANVPMGTSDSLPQINWLVQSPNSNVVAGIPDGDPSVAVSSLLTDTFWGLGFPRLGSLTIYQSYCLAAGFLVSPAIASSITASSFMVDLLKATNSNARWSSGSLTIVPYGDQPISLGQSQQAIEVFTISSFPVVIISHAATLISVNSVTLTSSGSVFTQVPYGTAPGSGQYSVSPTGVFTFSLLQVGASVTINYQWAAVASYIPQTQPIYDLTIDDFMPNSSSIGSGSSGCPVTVVRKPRDERLNRIRVEYLDRSNNYNPVVIDSSDEAAINLYRDRPSSINQFHFFCIGSAAQFSAAMLLRRESVARTYQATVGRHFVLLDTMDIVTLSEPAQGMFRQPVRITEIQENSDASLTITAEEFLGTASAPLYGLEAPNGYIPDDNADPGSILTPIIFEPTAEMLGAAGLEVWAAVCGVDNTIWGGAFIWVSYDNVNYKRDDAKVVGPARMGFTTSFLPSVTINQVGQTIDTTTTLGVDLSESAGTLISGTQSDALALNTACWVEGEVIAFKTATLTATSKYNLNYLVRGAFGTESSIGGGADFSSDDFSSADFATGGHPIGSRFVRLDAGVVAIPFDKSKIGSTIFVKFQSFNVWGGGLQSLADCAPYTYVITGLALASPLATITNLTSKIVTGRLNLTWDEIDDFRSGIRYEIRQGDTFDGALSLGTLAHPPFPVPGNGTYWVTGWCQPAPGLIVRSELPVSVDVSGSTIAPYVLATFDCKAAGWPGIFTGGAGVDNGLNAVRTGGAGNILSGSVIINLVTSAPTAAGGFVLTFASLPAELANLLESPNAWSIQDVTNPSAIPVGTLLDFSGATTINMTQAAAGAGVSSGDTILFTPPDILSAGGEQSGTYIPTFLVDAGRVTSMTVTISLKGTGIPVGQNILSTVDVLSVPDILGSASAAFVDVFASLLVSQSGVGSILTDANVLADPSILTYGIPFAAPQKYSPGDYFGQVLGFVFNLNTLDPASIALLLEAVIQVAVPARIDNILTNGTLPAAGLAVTFKPDGSLTPAPFNGGPNGSQFPGITATWGDEHVGDTLFIDPAQLTKAGCFIQIQNGGVGVQRNQVTLYAEGF